MAGYLFKDEIASSPLYIDGNRSVFENIEYYEWSRDAKREPPCTPDRSVIAIRRRKGVAVSTVCRLTGMHISLHWLWHFKRKKLLVKEGDDIESIFSYSPLFSCVCLINSKNTHTDTQKETNPDDRRWHRRIGDDKSRVNDDQPSITCSLYPLNPLINGRQKNYK